MTPFRLIALEMPESTDTLRSIRFAAGHFCQRCIALGCKPAPGEASALAVVFSPCAGSSPCPPAIAGAPARAGVRERLSCAKHASSAQSCPPSAPSLHMAHIAPLDSGTHRAAHAGIDRAAGMDAGASAPVEAPDTSRNPLIGLSGSAIRLLPQLPTQVACQACQGGSNQHGHRQFSHGRKAKSRCPRYSSKTQVACRTFSAAPSLRHRMIPSQIIHTGSARKANAPIPNSPSHPIPPR